MLWILWEFLAMVAVLALAVGLIVLVVKLSGKDSPWPGLIPIALLLVLVLAGNLAVSYRLGGEKLETLTEKLDNGMTAKMTVRTAGDEIRAYGPVRIVDVQGVLRDQGSVDAADLEDEEYQPPYSGIFVRMTAGKQVLPKWSMDQEIVTDMSQKIVFIKGDGEKTVSSYMTFDEKVLFLAPLLYMGLPMIVIYLFKRRQAAKRKQAKELRRMEIENL